IVSVIQRHIANGVYFDNALRGIPGLDLCNWDSKARPSYWFYTIMTDKREDLGNYLTEHGVANSRCHKRNDLHTLFSQSRRELPGLDRFYSRMLHIPCGWWVTDEDRGFIVETI